jgi:hypothetical protein
MNHDAEIKLQQMPEALLFLMGCCWKNGMKADREESLWRVIARRGCL